MTTKQAPVDAAFFRTMAGYTEDALLSMFPVIAKTRDRDALNGLLTFLEEDGFPNPKTGSAFSKNNLFDVLVNGSKEKMSLSRLVVCVLSNPDKSPFTEEARQDALAVVEKCLRIHTAHEASNSANTKSTFLDRALFDSISVIQDAEFITSLKEMGAETNSRNHSWMPNHFTDCEAITEAFRHQNMAAVEALIPHLWESHAGSFIDGVVAPYSTPENKPEVSNSMAKAFQEQPEAVLRVFSAMEARFGSENTAKARCRVLSTHLRNCCEQNVSWDEQSVVRLIDQTSESRQAMQAGASNDAQGIKTESAEYKGKVQIWRELFENALKVHCAPAVSMFEDRLKASHGFDYKRTQSPMHFLCSTVSPPQMFEPQRFKATLKCLIDNGHDISRSETGHPPAVHMIAKAKDDAQVRAQKLAVLLSFGADPFQHGQFGTSVSPTSKDGGKAAWDAVVRSHGARKAAMTLLDEIDAPAP